MSQIKRTSSELEFATQALKEGYSLEAVTEFLFGKTTPVVKQVVSQPVAPKGATEKPTKKPTTPKVETPKLELKVGAFFKATNLKTKDIVFVGKVKKLNSKDHSVVATNGKEYAVENCTAINQATFNKLSKSLADTAKKQAKKGSARVSSDIWTKLLCILANASNPSLGFGEFAKDSVKLTQQECKDINAQIKSELPDLKLTLKIANKLLDLLKQNPTAPAADLLNAYRELSK